jgi:hypothetical protein
VSHIKIRLRLYAFDGNCGDKLHSTLTLRLELISACGKHTSVNFWRVYEHTHWVCGVLIFSLILLCERPREHYQQEANSLSSPEKYNNNDLISHTLTPAGDYYYFAFITHTWNHEPTLLLVYACNKFARKGLCIYATSSSSLTEHSLHITHTRRYIYALYQIAATPHL